MNRIPTGEFTLSKEGGWDKFTMSKVQKWVRENLYGKRGRINVCMVQCNVAQDDANSKPDEWTVSLKVAGIHANYAGMPNRILPIDKEDKTDHSPTVGIWGMASFGFRCNEAEARKWDAQSKTLLPTVTVEGDIVGISFQPHLIADFNNFFIGYDTFVLLDNVALTPSKDTEPGALFACEFVNAQLNYLREPFNTITEIKRLDSSGDYQLIFLKLYNWGYGHKEVDQSTRLFCTPKFLPGDLIDTQVTFTPCGDPPTESQITEAKAKVGWPKN